MESRSRWAFANAHDILFLPVFALLPSFSLFSFLSFPVQSGVPLPFVSALLVLDSEGARVAVKYWDANITNPNAPTANTTNASNTAPSKSGAAPASTNTTGTSNSAEDLKVQMAFEKKVFGKTVRQQRQEGFDTIRQ